MLAATVSIFQGTAQRRSAENIHPFLCVFWRKAVVRAELALFSRKASGFSTRDLLKFGERERDLCSKSGTSPCLWDEVGTNFFLRYEFSHTKCSEVFHENSRL